MRNYQDTKRWPLVGWLPWTGFRSKNFRQKQAENANEALKRLPDYFFKTKRLVFRPLSPDDLSPLLEIVSKPEVSEFVDDGQPMDEELVKKWIEFSRLNIARHGSGTGALVSRSTGRIVGWAGLSRPQDSPPEIVYGLDNSIWRQGYGLEIASALVDWCRKDLSMPEVRATVYPGNTGSVRILEKLGFDYAGDLPAEGDLYCRLYVKRT